MSGKELTLEQLLGAGLFDTEAQVDTVDKDDDDAEESTQVNESNVLDMDVNELLSKSTTETTEEEEIIEPDETGEKEVKKVGDGPDSSKNIEKADEESQTPFTLTFARYQLEQGNISSLDEDELLKVIETDGEAAGMAYLQNKEAEYIRNTLLETYEDDVKYYLDLVDSGVDRDVAKNLSRSKAYYDGIKDNELEDEDKESLRKDILTQYYKLTTKFTDARIKKEIESKIALGEDVEAAKEALPEIKGYFKEAAENEKKQIEQQKKDAEVAAANMRKEFSDKVDSLTEIIPNVKLSKAEKDKIKDMVLKPVKEVNGVALNAVWAKRSENPTEFDTKLAALINYGIFDGKWDKVIKGAKTKATDELQKAITSNTGFKTNFSKSKATAGDSDEGANASIEAMRKAFKF
jgi:hypothetical protein